MLTIIQELARFLALTLLLIASLLKLMQMIVRKNVCLIVHFIQVFMVKMILINVLIIALSILMAITRQGFA
jgi:hypothetical protein